MRYAKMEGEEGQGDMERGKEEGRKEGRVKLKAGKEGGNDRSWKGKRKGGLHDSCVYAYEGGRKGSSHKANRRTSKQRLTAAYPDKLKQL